MTVSGRVGIGLVCMLCMPLMLLAALKAPLPQWVRVFMGFGAGQLLALVMYFFGWWSKP